jgi:tetratricopeptide (TPR) repeat protein
LDVLEIIKKIVVEDGPEDNLVTEGDRQQKFDEYEYSVLIDHSKYENAILCYDEAIKIDPKYCVPWERKAMIYSKLKKHEEAITCYDKVIEIESPKGADWYLASIWGWKGSSYEQLGKHEEAKECSDNYKKIRSAFDAKIKSMSDTKKSSS